MSPPEGASRRLSRRHPDIEVARLLVKHGLLGKSQAVTALKEQKRRARDQKPRIPFLRFLLKREVLSEPELRQARDLVREHTYICEACDARAVIVAGSQTRAGLCPRCGAEISVDGTLIPPAARDVQSDTQPWPRRKAGLPQHGQTVFGRYKLFEEIGRGAMGVVYRARHFDLDKDVALKLLTPSEDGREHQVARFRREAAAVQKLRHPGIIAVHDFGHEGDVYYLTMDLVQEAKTLHQALKNRDQPLPLQRRLELLIEVAHAVQHAHERGVIHRDLKPANVLITREGAARVVDFGLAKDEEDEQGELTRTHDRLGTPLFMAPEQIRRGASDVDARADVWALGIMLFVCATGRYPFRSRTVMDLYLRIMREPPDWTGARYSAPDRNVGPNPFVSSEDLVVDETLSEERTEVSTRHGPEGKLPETLSSSPQPLPLPPPFAPPPELRGEAPDKVLRAIIECALAKTPEDRYATAGDLAQDLERYLAGQGTLHARRPPLLKRLRRQLRRPRVLVALAASAVVVAAGLGFALYTVAARAQSVRETRIADALGQAPPEDPQARIDYCGTALPRIQKLLEDYPDDATLLYHAGTCHLRLLDVAAAQDVLERARGLSEDPAQRQAALRELIVAHALLGEYRQALSLGAEGLGEGEAPAAETALRAAEACFAASQHGVEDLQPARERIEAALREAVSRPDAPPEATAYFARMALLRGDVKAAAARLPRAPEDPADEAYCLQLVRGAVALAEGRAKDARGDFARAGSAWRSRDGKLEGDVALFNLQGYLLKRTKDTQRSVLANRAASFLAPYHPFPLYYVARTALTLGADLSLATEYQRLAFEADPLSADGVDFYLALLESHPDLRERQREVLDLALQADPTNPELHLRGAYLSAREGQRGPTEASLERAAELDATYGSRGALLRAAWARKTGDASLAATLEAGYAPGPRERKGREEWARELFDREQVAAAFLAWNRPQDALAAIEPLRQLSVEFVDRSVYTDAPSRMHWATVHVHEARAYALLGEPGKAIGALRKAYLNRIWSNTRDRLEWHDPLPPRVTPAALTRSELTTLAGNPDYEQILAALRAGQGS